MDPLSNRRLLRLHRYAGLFAAPMLLMFAISGIWQVYRFQQSRKDGSYVAPPTLTLVSEMHMAEGMGRNPRGGPFRIVAAFTGGVLVVTTALGALIGLRLTRPRWIAVAVLAAGAALPTLLFVLAKLAAEPGG